jgi:hypothetical protein
MRLSQSLWRSATSRAIDLTSLGSGVKAPGLSFVLLMQPRLPMSATFLPICAVCGKSIRPLERTGYAWLPGGTSWLLAHRACMGGDSSPAPAFVWPLSLRPLTGALAPVPCYG